MQRDWDHLLFYLNTLYEFVHEISEPKRVEEILKRMLRIVTGAFGLTRGMVIFRQNSDSPFELITHEHLDTSIIESISQQLRMGVLDDPPHVNGLVELFPALQSPSTSTRLCQMMADAGMTTMTVFRIKERLTACVGLGPQLSEMPFSEHQIELLSALTKHTEIALGNALFYQDILQENQQLKAALHQQYRFDNIVGQSEKMQEIYQRIQQIAMYPNYSVLISGESGTGKELIVRAIHHHGPRKDQRFLAINCAALPRELVESELFGHERGAFTGATATKPGLFEMAEGGTLFLDEIAEMPTATQAKLLRVLEQKEVMRLGGSDVRVVDVRIIAATNRDLTRAIADGQFREDLFYRFDIIIHTPRLRERKEDIPLLVQTFLEEIARENRQSTRTVSPEGLKALMDYDWPGNVRELKKVLIEAVLMTENTRIQAGDISLPRDQVQTIAQVGSSLKASGEQLKRMMIEDALRRYDGNKTQAAAQLGITRQNLQNMVRRLNIN